MISRKQRLASLTASILAAAFLVACGGDDSNDDAPEEEAAPAVDAEAFKDCIFSGALDIGIYEEVKDTDPTLSDAAPEATFFEAGKGDDGIVAFYVFDDAEAADTFATGEFVETFNGFAEQLAEGAGVKPTTPAVEAHDSVVVALIPFTAEKEAEISEEVGEDVANCSEEAAA